MDIKKQCGLDDLPLQGVTALAGYNMDCLTETLDIVMQRQHFSDCNDADGNDRWKYTTTKIRTCSRKEREGREPQDNVEFYTTSDRTCKNTRGRNRHSMCVACDDESWPILWRRPMVENMSNESIVFFKPIRNLFGITEYENYVI